MNYRIGLDIGIGSVGWAVVSAEENGHSARIEDFGSRIFESGENSNTRASLCQERRQNRGVRRLERRRANRKKLLENHFRNIGLINLTFNDDYAEIRDADVYQMKVRGIEEKLSPAELFKCLIHTCNHRGYSSFYETDDGEGDKEEGANAEAVSAFEKDFRDSQARNVSEYLIHKYPNNGFVKFRNRDGGNGAHILISRKLLKEETECILDYQSHFYPVLNPENVSKTIGIIFAQRDFEDGPGDPNDPTRRYQGFLETLGQCPYYKDEKRGFRGTVLADVYAVTNTLSQYRFVNKASGAYELDSGVAKELVYTLLMNANLTMSDVKRILNCRGYELLKSDKSDDKALGKAIKFLKLAKKCAEEAGMDWESLISEPQFDPDAPSLLHRIGELISKFQTPDRRRKEMKAAGIPAELIKTFSSKKISGTAAVSYQYMLDSIEAFMEGDIYGNFQAQFIRMHEEICPVEKSVKLAPRHIDDPEVRDNRVVFKAINETRKIVNAIIERYGSPQAIIIEVASELGKSVEMRDEEAARQHNNEKDNDRIKKEIAELLGISVEEVKGGMIERYKLHKEQGGKSVYSGIPLGELVYVVKDENHEYEIDHIVPYSWILDNTLNNKVLVFAGENQAKGQRAPRSYLEGENLSRFLAAVNEMYSRKEKPISRKKLAYFMFDIAQADAEEILGEWKSRNINDTRYITKYIAGLFERYLVFAGDQKQHVFTVKGSVSQKFRQEWLIDSKWGAKEKDRSTYLHHAVDAVIVANLTKAYIEIGSDALRLIAIYKQHRKRITPEYEEYLDDCVAKMKKYYGFDEEYTRKLLSKTGRVPSYVPNLKAQIDARFIDNDEKTFNDSVRKVYRGDTGFIRQLHMPVTSHKMERKYQGTISDDNLIRVVTIDGEQYKVNRISIKKLTRKQFVEKKLYTTDPSLEAQIKELFDGCGEDTLEKCMKAKGMDKFVTGTGIVIRKVSVIDKKISGVYKKTVSDDNYSILGGPKYYCVEVYEDKEGKTQTHGIRFVDVIKKNGKLYCKSASRPEDYGKHIMYLFVNDYIKVFDRKGTLKFSGFYRSVYNINQSRFSIITENGVKSFMPYIASNDTVKKYDVSILGKIGGEIVCSEPLQYIEEKSSL